MDTTTLPGIRPNARIWGHANSYHEAAVLCKENRLALPAAINAALAIELYLKSFLAVNTLTEKGGFLGFRAEKGHFYTELIEKFDPKHKEQLISALNEVSGKRDWLSIFEKYENTFTKTRYWYESDSAVAINFEIVDLAGSLKEAVLRVGRQETA